MLHPNESDSEKIIAQKPKLSENRYLDMISLNVMKANDITLNLYLLTILSRVLSTNQIFNFIDNFF